MTVLLLLLFFSIINYSHNYDFIHIIYVIVRCNLVLSSFLWGVLTCVHWFIVVLCLNYFNCALVYFCCLIRLLSSLFFCCYLCACVCFFK